MPRSRYGTIDWVTGPTMVNAVIRSALGAMPTIRNAVTFGMAYWSGISTETGRMSSPTRRRAAAGSRR